MVSRYVKQEKIWEHGAILEENKYHPGDPWYNKAANMHEATMLSMYLLWFLKLVQFLLSLVMYTLPYSGTMANKIESSKNIIKPRINLNHTIYIHVLLENCTIPDSAMIILIILIIVI